MSLLALKDLLARLPCNLGIVSSVNGNKIIWIAVLELIVASSNLSVGKSLHQIRGQFEVPQLNVICGQEILLALGEHFIHELCQMLGSRCLQSLHLACQLSEEVLFLLFNCSVDLLVIAHLAVEDAELSLKGLEVGVEHPAVVSLLWRACWSILIEPHGLFESSEEEVGVLNLIQLSAEDFHLSLALLGWCLCSSVFGSTVVGLVAWLNHLCLLVGFVVVFIIREI